MSVIWALSTRNIKLYLRNRMSVFFSLLSVLIILVLFLLFLGQMQLNSVSGVGSGGKLIVSGWLLAGLLVVNATSVPMVLLSRMVSDIDKNIFRDFLVAPLSRRQIILGYLCSATLVGWCSTVLMYLVGQAYLMYLGAPGPGVFSLLMLLLLMLLAVMVSAAMLFLIIVILKKESSVTTVNSIIGTLIGFVAGIYIPIGALSDQVQELTKLFPQTHMTSMLRQLIIHDAAGSSLQTVAPDIMSAYRFNYGIDLFLGKHLISPLWSVLYCTLLSALFVALSIWVLQHSRGDMR